MKRPPTTDRSMTTDDLPFKEPLWIRLIQAGVVLIYLLALFAWERDHEIDKGKGAAMMLLAGMGADRLSARPGSSMRTWITAGLLTVALVLALWLRFFDHRVATLGTTYRSSIINSAWRSSDLPACTSPTS